MIFCPNRPYYYGGLGSLGGHEITHGFDTNGMFYTKTGDLTSQWWTNATLDAFKNVTSCFVDFFGKYEVQGIKVRDSVHELRHH